MLNSLFVARFEARGSKRPREEEGPRDIDVAKVRHPPASMSSILAGLVGGGVGLCVKVTPSLSGEGGGGGGLGGGGGGGGSPTFSVRGVLGGGGSPTFSVGGILGGGGSPTFSVGGILGGGGSPTFSIGGILGDISPTFFSGGVGSSPTRSFMGVGSSTPTHHRQYAFGSPPRVHAAPSMGGLQWKPDNTTPILPFRQPSLGLALPLFLPPSAPGPGLQRKPYDGSPVRQPSLGLALHFDQNELGKLVAQDYPTFQDDLAAVALAAEVIPASVVQVSLDYGSMPVHACMMRTEHAPAVGIAEPAAAAEPVGITKSGENMYLLERRVERRVERGVERGVEHCVV